MLSTIQVDNLKGCWKDGAIFHCIIEKERAPSTRVPYHCIVETPRASGARLASGHSLIQRMLSTIQVDNLKGCWKDGAIFHCIIETERAPGARVPYHCIVETPRASGARLASGHSLIQRMLSTIQVDNLKDCWKDGAIIHCIIETAIPLNCRDTARVWRALAFWAQSDSKNAFYQTGR